ncbi:MAG: hypothetical protein KAT40_01670 [Bacteroidales bacterium]|nr:hypothetical protein [Bacteroidales bacterium]
MKKVFLFSALVFFAFSGCEKEESPDTSGEATLTSYRFLEGSTYSTYGFSFEQGKVIKYNLAVEGIIPDFFIEPIPGTSGQVTGAWLASLNLNESFSLTAEFSDSLLALQYFSEYKNIIDSNFVFLANPLNENQVWTFCTRDNKFGKILIKEVKAFVKDTKNYAETTFLWEFQPDGSMEFK